MKKGTGPQSPGLGEEPRHHTGATFGNRIRKGDLGTLRCSHLPRAFRHHNKHSDLTMQTYVFLTYLAQVTGTLKTTNYRATQTEKCDSLYKAGKFLIYIL